MKPEIIDWALRNTGWMFSGNKWRSPYVGTTSNRCVYNTLEEAYPRMAADYRDAMRSRLTANDLIYEARVNVEGGGEDRWLHPVEYSPTSMSEVAWFQVAHYLAGMVAAWREG